MLSTACRVVSCSNIASYNRAVSRESVVPGAAPLPPQTPGPLCRGLPHTPHTRRCRRLARTPRAVRRGTAFSLNEHVSVWTAENYHGSNTVFLVAVLMSVVGGVFIVFALSALCYRSVVVHKNFSLCLRLVSRKQTKGSL